MKYLLMLCSDVTYRDDLEEAAREGCGDWPEAAGPRHLLSAGLRPATDATTVRVRGADVLFTDGPFAETKDQIGGVSLIEASDLDEALELAAAHPWARIGQIEVRPVLEP